MAAVASASSVSSAPWWQRALPHVLAVLFFVVLACLYFSPIMFEGKTLAQHDITQFQGGAHEAQEYAKAMGKEALWTNSMFSGMPTYLISLHFPGDWSVYLQKVLTLGLPAVVANLFLALLCGYILLVALGVRPLVAVAGAVALGFSSYNLAILAAGHNTKSLALAYAPLVLGGLLVTYRRDKWLGAALFAVGLTLNVHVNHLQITYYLLLLVALFGIFELVAAARAGRLPEFFKRTALLGLGAALAVGVSFGRLYTTLEYSKYSNRGRTELKTPAPNAPGQAAAANPEEASTGVDRDYAFQYSYGVGETITLLIPNFYGGASAMPLGPESNLAKAGLPPEYLNGMPTYWGQQSYTAGPVYMGAVVCFLFILGLFVVDKRTRYWLLAGTVLSILLAWGKNFESFNYLIFDLLPGYNKFRAVSMALVIAQLAMPILGALALSRVLRPRPAPHLLAPADPQLHPALAKAAKAAGTGSTAPVASPEAATLLPKVLYAGAITAGLCLLAYLASFSFDFAAPIDNELTKQGFTPQLLSALRADRADLLRNDVWRGLLFIGAALAVLYFHLKGRLAMVPAAALMVALVLVDLWGVDKRYLGTDKFQPTSIAASFQPTPADELILRDTALSYRVLNMQNPFNEAQTSYFHKSIGGYHGAKLRRYQDLIERQISNNNQQVLNMLNTRYLLTGDPKQPVQRNPGALGNAWFVSTVKTVNSPDEEMAALSTLSPATEAVVDASKFPQQKAATYDAAGSTITLTNYSPDELKYRYTAKNDGFVVFSEIFYADGWQAFIDGKPVPHLRADYVLRAMPVPAGSHVIDFKFEPKAYAVGNAVSLASSIVLLLVLVGAGVYLARRKQVVEDDVVATAVPVA
ncbi:YfhO family protein [Hymenobacter sp. BT770]|uniref:YfhO family protein n=1 Tax=Hymenobacter sp. BT770 TaxID=2886942 RepID=UPI001D11F17D|nr:YfhO family protein [Hymenobacter sp. BT770]MCC3153604.1 YfhO family protein [Hymenobacter sp. BT770]MDO3415930.1 YfhO family protein [Hymenobacter sp. BT770]